MISFQFCCEHTGCLRTTVKSDSSFAISYLANKSLVWFWFRSYWTRFAVNSQELSLDVTSLTRNEPQISSKRFSKSFFFLFFFSFQISSSLIKRYISPDQIFGSVVRPDNNREKRGLKSHSSFFHLQILPSTPPLFIPKTHFWLLGVNHFCPLCENAFLFRSFSFSFHSGSNALPGKCRKRP